jgi:hypothetical protein
MLATEKWAVNIQQLVPYIREVMTRASKAR